MQTHKPVIITMTIFNRTTFDNADFKTLVALLDKDLSIRDGEEHAFYAQFNKVQNIQHVIVCYRDDKPIGCGAFREYAHQKVEIKRMFVLPAYRGHGIAFNILKELELWALELSNTACVLETGKKQPEAISLYKKAGYDFIESYGQYKNVENSVCMMKSIV